MTLKQPLRAAAA